MDEKTIRGLERLVDHEQGAVDSLERQFPHDELRNLPRDQRLHVHSLKNSAWADLENAKSKLAEARARFESDSRERSEKAQARTVVANERMAEASEAAAVASANAARWAKWAAIFTAIAAGGSLIGTWLQVRK